MKFLIADDHAIVRKGLIQLLREEYTDVEIAEAVNGNEVLEAARKQSIDIILMDISMPGRNGIEALKQLRAEGIGTPVLIISMHPEESYAVRALKAGASGYLTKESATEELITAIHKIVEGHKYVTPSIAEKLAEAIGESRPAFAHELLSDREMQVLQRIASGKTVSEIAGEFSLSIHTVSTYRARIFEKLHLRNNAELTRYAIDHGLV
jgi:DNA-binding NarL/FixJ family response regulator